MVPTSGCEAARSKNCHWRPCLELLGLQLASSGVLSFFHGFLVSYATQGEENEMEKKGTYRVAPVSPPSAASFSSPFFSSSSSSSSFLRKLSLSSNSLSHSSLLSLSLSLVWLKNANAPPSVSLFFLGATRPRRPVLCLSLIAFSKSTEQCHDCTVPAASFADIFQSKI